MDFAAARHGGLPVGQPTLRNYATAGEPALNQILRLKPIGLQFISAALYRNDEHLSDSGVAKENKLMLSALCILGNVYHDE